VPLMLFAGTVSTPRAELSQDLPLLIALCVAVVGLYGAVLLLSRFAFRRPLSTSTAWLNPPSTGAEILPTRPHLLRSTH
jgi:predicted permease